MEKNILGTALEDCSLDPKTGFFRNGRCDTCEEDVGLHTVCARLTEDFLQYSKSMGNDLITPRKEIGFPGLKAGDHWCICLGRWIEALEAGVAPGLCPRATHKSVLEHMPIEVLEKHFITDA